MISTRRPLFSIVKTSFRQWLFNPRYYVLAILTMLLAFTFLSPLRLFCHVTGYNVSPYVLPHFVSVPYFSILLLLGYILLFCDAPFIGSLTPYECIRAGKAVWLRGKSVYVVLASFIYAVFVQITVWAVSLPYLAWIGEWGKVIKTLAFTSAGAEFKLAFFDDVIIERFKPLEATLLSLLMLWGQGMIIGFILLTAGLLTRMNRTAGLAAAGIYSLSPQIAGFWQVNRMYKYIPAVWLQLDLLDKPSGTNTVNPDLIISYGLVFLLVVMLALLSQRLIRRKSIDNYEQI